MMVPNSARYPLELIEETETWLYAEALQIEAILGDTPLVQSLRGRAAYLRNVRTALSRLSA
jgi:hypothetical protein